MRRKWLPVVYRHAHMHKPLMQICACMHTPQPHESNEDRRREEERWTPINLQSIQKLSPMNQLDDIFWYTEKKTQTKSKRRHPSRTRAQGRTTRLTRTTAPRPSLRTATRGGGGGHARERAGRTTDGARARRARTRDGASPRASRHA